MNRNHRMVKALPIAALIFLSGLVTMLVLGQGGTGREKPNSNAKKTTPAAKRPAPSRKPPARNPAAKNENDTVENQLWESIKNSTDPADFQAYLRDYPQGKYAPLARLKLRRLETLPGPENNTNANNNPAVVKPAATAPKPVSVVRNQMGMELVYIAAGSFLMGSDSGEADEKPVHQVTISQPFYMGKYEVTQAQWRTVMGGNPSRFKGDNLPVEQVSWLEAQSFIQKLNAANDGFLYRLPTEAEWEYACRAGTTGDYAASLDSSAWFGNNSGRQSFDALGLWRTARSSYAMRITENANQTHATGEKQANAFGLHDMHGNVWEWCQDRYHNNYNGAPADGSGWESGGDADARVLRGCSWASNGRNCRSAARAKNTTDDRNSNDGFRVVAVKRSG
jgi:formylglycine-generating enzyme required for sulfatase activity